MIRLYIDENVEGAITRGVRRRGCDVLTAQEDGHSGVIYAHQLRVSIGQCVTDLTTLAQQGESHQFVDRVRYLPLR